MLPVTLDFWRLNHTRRSNHHKLKIDWSIYSFDAPTTTYVMFKETYREYTQTETIYN